MNSKNTKKEVAGWPYTPARQKAYWAGIEGCHEGLSNPYEQDGQRDLWECWEAGYSKYQEKLDECD